jgi:hypothetical protein
MAAWLWRCAALVLALGLAGPGWAQGASCPGLPGPRSAPPADLARVLEALRRAVLARDAAAVRAIAAPDIVLDFGGTAGADGMRLDGPDAPGWAGLRKVLMLGCAPTGAVPPGWECPGAAPDEGSVLVPVRNLRLRARPDPEAPVLALVSCRVLQRDGEGSPGWVPVRLPDGRRGYLPAQLVRAPGDHRALFERREGGWRMTYFVAGD